MPGSQHVAQMAFQRDQQRQIDRYQVGAADDGLCHVLRQRDPAAGNSVISSLLPFSIKDGMNLADHVLHETRLFRADLIAVDIRHNMDDFNALQSASSMARSTPSAVQFHSYRYNDSGMYFLDSL